MAQVTITITDKPNGKVEVKLDPTAEHLIRKQVSGEDLTSAEGYALFCVRQIRQESKRQATQLPIYIPRIGR